MALWAVARLRCACVIDLATDSGGGRQGGEFVFISYSRHDVAWRHAFEVMLKPLVRNRGLEVWSDERNVVGEQWRPQLAAAIERSTVALVLVSAELLASRFIVEQELPALVEAGATLACVLVGDCLWQ